MKLEKITDKDLILSLSMEELETINNALNEVCNAFDMNDFETRMGATVEEAQKLLSQISEVFRAI
jgi:hypothetical protein